MIDRRRRVLPSVRRSACRAVPALIALASVACHDFTESRVTVQYVAQAGTNVQGLAVSLQAGQTVETFASLVDVTPAPVFEMNTPASGFVVVAVALVDTLGGAIGGGATAIELRRNATLSVTVQIDSLNPANLCAECLGSKPFTLLASHQRGPGDSIWVVWTATPSATSITK